MSKPLSPAAQAVKDAIGEADAFWDEEVAAAILRALVSELGTRTSGGAIILNGDTVLAIATELEAPNV